MQNVILYLLNIFLKQPIKFFAKNAVINRYFFKLLRFKYIACVLYKQEFTKKTY